MAGLFLKQMYIDWQCQIFNLTSHFQGGGRVSKCEASARRLRISIDSSW